MLDDLEKLLEKSGEALRRDLNHILAMSTGGKLDASSARDLVAYTKLLHDIKDRNADLEKEVSKLVSDAIARANSTASTGQAKD